MNFLKKVQRTLFGLRAAFAIATFFGASLVIGLALTLVSPFIRRDRARMTRLVRKACERFVAWARFLRLVKFQLDPLMLDLKGPSVVIANHPSILDAVVLLGTLEDVVCLYKPSWLRSVLLGPLLTRTNFVKGLGLDEEPRAVVDRMVEALRRGDSVVVFPEGGRSGSAVLRKFTTGPFEAAIVANVPITSVLVRVDPPVLPGTPGAGLPMRTIHYRCEVLSQAVPETTDRRLAAKHARANYLSRLSQGPRAASLLEEVQFPESQESTPKSQPLT